jgi:hypothetical protein
MAIRCQLKVKWVNIDDHAGKLCFITYQLFCFLLVPLIVTLAEGLTLYATCKEVVLFASSFSLFAFSSKAEWAPVETDVENAFNELERNQQRRMGRFLQGLM